MTAAVRELHWVGASETQALKQTFVNVMRRWSQHWCPDLPMASLGVEPLTQALDGDRWQWIHGNANRGVWRRRPDDLEAILVSRWTAAFDTRAFKAGDWALAVAARALNELDARLLAFNDEANLVADTPEGLDSRTPEQLWIAAQKPYSGAVLFQEVTLGLSWLMTPNAYRRRPVLDRMAGMPEQPTALSLVDTAANHPVRLTVELDPLEISLDEALSLEVGDVVRFAHKLQDPMDLVVAHDGPTPQRLACHLAQVDGRLVAAIAT